MTITFTTNIYEDRESYASPELLVHPIALTLTCNDGMIVIMMIVMMRMMIDDASDLMILER